ncbi:hypothetical protein AYX13_01098 [Cryptococcus neoformans]|nr:hypothetical protein AYX13_01098 [Cryptococcus neoformans var. grubii]
MPQQSSEQSPVANICQNSFSIIKLKEFLHPSAPCDTRLADSCLMECIGWLGRVIRLAGQKDGKLYAVEAASGHHCKVGNWVICRGVVLQSLACFEGKILYGRIDDIVSSSEDDLGMVTINRCTIGGNRHPVHGMPMLQRNDGVFVTVLSQAVWLTSSLIRAKRE